MALIAHDLSATISHKSAAQVWGLDVVDEAEEVVVSVNKCRSRLKAPGVRVHRRNLTSGDRRWQHGVPVTSPMQTLADLARTLSLEDAVIAIDCARRKGLVSDRQVLALGEHAMGPGAGRVRAAMMASDDRADSPPETRLRLWLMAEPRVGRVIPQMRLRRNGHAYDCGLPDLRTVVEFQSWLWHGERAVWVKDTRWGNQAHAALYGYVQLVHEDMLRGREWVIATVLGVR